MITKPHFPHLNFQLSELPTCLKFCVWLILTKQKSKFFKLHTHCKNCMYLIVLFIFFVTLMQENPKYSVFSLQTVGFYCILVGLFWKIGIFGAKYPIITSVSYIFAGNNPKNREILAKCLQIQSNFPKTWEIRGKMLNILAKWLHYLWIFPNIWGILINLLHLCGDFSEDLGNSYHKYIHFFFAKGKIIGFSHNQCIQCVQCVQCVQKYYNFFSLTKIT